MPRRSLALAIAATAALVVAAAETGSDSALPDGRASGGQRSADWSGRTLTQDFSGRRLNRRIWNTCHWWADRGCTIASNNELEWYLPRQVRVRKGRLRLVARRRPTQGADGRRYPFVSGMISSGPPYDSRKPRFAFRYGRAEIRARVPAGKGLWSAFWLLPASRRSKPEIDVMEVLGHAPTTVEMHLHYRRPDGTVGQRGKEWRDAKLRSGWHTYAVDWRPGRLAWLIDGVVRWRVHGRAVPRVPMYLVANLAVGGDWPGPPSSSTRFPSALEIDYVRVRQ